jgi:hypothetical protein
MAKESVVASVVAAMEDYRRTAENYRRTAEDYRRAAQEAVAVMRKLREAWNNAPDT